MHQYSPPRTPSRARSFLGAGGICRLVAYTGVVTLALAGIATWHTGFAAAATTAPPVCSTTPATNTTGGPAYYLFESNGAVISCGGAPLHGSKAGTRRMARVIGGAATPTGTGYWLATSAGAVFSFGSAGFFGSALHLHLHSPVVSFAPTPDDGGYWLVTAAGNLFHFGDAGFFGSTVRDRSEGSVVSILPTPDGQGYWIVTDRGAVHAFGDAAPVGSLSLRRPLVVAATATPDGRGVLLLEMTGGIQNLGTGGFFGSLVHEFKPRPPSAIAATSDGGGYLVALETGNIYNFGDATFEGSLATSPPRRPVAVVSIAGVSLPAPVVSAPAPGAPPEVSTPLIPHGQFGYDISNYQCASPGSPLASPSLPASAPFAIIEASGWLDNSDNSCLAAEAAWATQAAGPNGAPYSLYLFTNAPDQSAAASALDATGPAGTCATLAPSAQATCTAYNYGYGGASASYAYAASLGVTSSLWWLDVEGTNLSPNQWSNFPAGQIWSASPALNDATIQGAIDALRSHDATVGLYSSALQYPLITGQYVPNGAQVPLWIAGAPLTNPPYAQTGLAAQTVLTGWCLGTSGYTTNPTDLFANGAPWVLQETPGGQASPYGIDPNYGC